jgi:hypothetical protein
MCSSTRLTGSLVQALRISLTLHYLHNHPLIILSRDEEKNKEVDDKQNNDQSSTRDVTRTAESRKEGCHLMKGFRANQDCSNYFLRPFPKLALLSIPFLCGCFVLSTNILRIGLNLYLSLSLFLHVFVTHNPPAPLNFRSW